MYVDTEERDQHVDLHMVAQCGSPPHACCSCAKLPRTPVVVEDFNFEKARHPDVRTLCLHKNRAILSGGGDPPKHSLKYLKAPSYAMSLRSKIASERRISLH